MSEKGQSSSAFFRIVWIVLFIQVVLISVFLPQINKSLDDPLAYPYSVFLEEEIPAGGEFVLSLNFMDKIETNMGLCRHVGGGTEIRVLNGNFEQIYQGYIDHYLYHLGLSGVDVDGDSYHEMVLAEFFRDGEVVSAYGAEFDSVRIGYHDPDNNFVIFDRFFNPGKKGQAWTPRMTPLLRLDSVTPVETEEYFTVAYAGGMKYPNEKYVRVYKKSQKPELHAEIRTLLAPQHCDIYKTPDGEAHIVIGGTITGEGVEQKISYKLPDGRVVNEIIKDDHSVVTQYSLDGELEWATQIKKGTGRLLIYAPQDSMSSLLAFHVSTQFYSNNESAQTSVYLNRSNGAIVDSVTRKGNFSWLVGLAVKESDYLGILHENSGKCFLVNKAGSTEEWIEAHITKIRPFAPLAKIEDEFVLPLGTGEDQTMFYNLKGKQLALANRSFWCKPFSNIDASGLNNDAFCLRNENVFQMYSLEKRSAYASALYNYKWLIIAVLFVPFLTIILYWTAKSNIPIDNPDDEYTAHINQLKKQLLGKDREIKDIIEELNDRKRFEEKVYTRLDLHNTIINAMAEPLATIDKNFKFTYVSDTFAELYGIPSDIIVGQQFLQDQRGGLKNQLMEIFKHNNAAFNYPVEITNNNGDKLLVEIEGSLIKTEPDDQEHLLLKFKDVTALLDEDPNAGQLPEGYGELVGSSLVMQKVYKQIEQLRDVTGILLVHGETGTGKELVANAIHSNTKHAHKEMVRVNCAGIANGLYESAFFGHKKGAFTGAIRDEIGYFEKADGSTLFLDEFGDIPIHAQAKILRAIETKMFSRVGSSNERTFDALIILATKQNLEEMKVSKEFRDDLYYRTSAGIAIELPPLRDRQDDIYHLAFHFLEQLNKDNNRNVKSFSKNAIEMLEKLKWEGNVRELREAIRSAMIYCNGDIIRRSDFANYLERLEKIEVAKAKVEAKENNGSSKLFEEKKEDFARPKKARQSSGVDENLLRSNIDDLLQPKYTFESLFAIDYRKMNNEEKEYEKRVYQLVLHSFNWNQAKTSRFLDVSTATVKRRIKDYDLGPNES